MQLKERVRAIILKDAPHRRASSRRRPSSSTASSAGSRRASGPSRPPVETASSRGKTVLVIDDDVRNIFALTTMLEERGLKVLFAENGRDGLILLGAHPEVALVLTDVMMPEMDGYDTMRAIRANPSYSDLPIIALTAKAMKGRSRNASKPGPQTT